MTRRSPFLLTGSDGSRSPAFCRYYETATTTGLLWRCSVCHVASPYLGLTPSVRSPTRGKSPRRRQGVVQPVSPSVSGGYPKDTFGSPKFPANPSCLRPALRLRSGLHARLLAALWCCPRSARRRGPQLPITFEVPSHGFGTRCLRFVPPSRTTTQNSLPVASHSFPGELSHAHWVRSESFRFRFPPPRASLGATCS
jgi:hypothetical protein